MQVWDPLDSSMYSDDCLEVSFGGEEEEEERGGYPALGEEELKMVIPRW